MKYQSTIKFLVCVLAHAIATYTTIALGERELEEVLRLQSDSLSTTGYVIMFFREAFTFPLSIFSSESIELSFVGFLGLIIFNSLVIVSILFVTKYKPKLWVRKGAS